jgi:hypothetical protein
MFDVESWSILIFLQTTVVQNQNSSSKSSNLDDGFSGSPFGTYAIDFSHATSFGENIAPADWWLLPCEGYSISPFFTILIRLPNSLDLVGNLSISTKGRRHCRFQLQFFHIVCYEVDNI